MNSTTKKFVHDLVAEGLGLPKQRVIWYDPNAPRPTKPYATLDVFGEVREGQEELRKTATAGKYDVFVPVTQTLRVELYGLSGDDVCESLNVLARKMETPTFADKCFANSVAFYDAENVVDLTDVLEQSIDVRASVDFHVRTNSIIEDDCGVIEQVKVDENIYIDDTDILTRQYTIAVQNGGI